MSWDQQANSFVCMDEEPLTPTATPSSATAPSFGLFETPKTEPSIFDQPNLWNSTTPCGTSPQLRTPQYLAINTSIQPHNYHPGQTGSRPGPEDIDAEIASHIHHLSPDQSLSLPPVEPSRRLTSSPIPSPTYHRRPEPISISSQPYSEPGIKKRQNRSEKSARSIQTPPPTASSAAKRKAKQEQVADLVRASAAASKDVANNPSYVGTRQFNRPSSSWRDNHKHFQNLQFSPDVFDSHPLSGPATAPAYPQHRLFWDPNVNTASMNLDIGSNFEGFGGKSYVHDAVRTEKGREELPSMALFNFTSNAESGLEQNRTSSSNGMHLSLSQQPTTQRLPVESTWSQESSSLSTPLGDAVDPNVLTSFASSSSQIAMAPPPSKASRLSTSLLDGSRIPYQHQQEESKRERELDRARKLGTQRVGKLQRIPDTSLNDVLGSQFRRPHVKRRATNTVVERDNDQSDRIIQKLKPHVNAISSEYSIPSQADQLPVQGRSNQSFGAKVENTGKRLRTAVTLSIGPNGRAYTETRAIKEPSESGSDSDVMMGLDASDSDDASSDGGDLDHITSCNTSFTFPQQEYRRTSSKSSSGKPLPQSEPALTNLPSAYSISKFSAVKSIPISTVSSMKNRLQESHQHMLDYDKMTQSRYSEGLPPEPESEAETVVDPDDEKGGAQYALRKLIRDRSRGHDAAALPMSRQDHKPAKDRKSLFLFPHDGLDPGLNGKYHHGVNDSFGTTSPTTNTELGITDQSSQMSEDTRCVCKVTNNEHYLMIQCDSCAKWLHIKCVGLHQDRLPPVYVCIYCTGQTPNVRGGRIREPVRPPAVSSPLAHKLSRPR